MTVVKLVVQSVDPVTGAEDNIRVIIPTKAQVQNNGTRATDTGEFTIPITGVIKQNDLVSYVQDVIDTQSLVSIYNFKGSARDEGGFDLDGDDRTFTASFVKRPTNSPNEKFDRHYAIEFDAAGQKITIPHTERHDFTSTFDICIHYEASVLHFDGNDNNRLSIMFSKIDLGGGGNGIMLGLQYDSTPGLWRVFAGLRTGGVDSSLIDTDDNNFAASNKPLFIRLTRDENDLVSLYFGDVLVASATVSGSLDAALTDTIIGDVNGDGIPYDGFLYQIRIYDGHLNNEQHFIILSAVPQWSTMKIRGKVWKIKEKTASKTVTIRSINQILFRTKLSKQNLDAGEPSSPYAKRTTSRVLNVFEDKENSNDIIHDILGKIDVNILFYEGGDADGVDIGDPADSLLNGYRAVGALIKNLEILTVMDNSVFWFNARQVFIVERPQESRLYFENSIGYSITSSGKDDITTVNDLQVVGQNATLTNHENIAPFTTTFGTSEHPLDVRILSVGVYLRENVTFRVNIESKTITFTPALGANGAEIFYRYEDDSRIIARQIGDNIAGIGTYARNLVTPQIVFIDNLNTFTSHYVTGDDIARQNINERFRVVAPALINSVRENIKPTIKNTIKGIDQTAIISSITYSYPQNKTIIECGEHVFDSFDLQKRLVEDDDSTGDTVLTTKNI